MIRRDPIGSQECSRYVAPPHYRVGTQVCSDIRTHRRWRERGTVLMLFPAAVFVVCVLGALAVDSANVVMQRRDLQHAADAAANDAAALGLDVVALRQGRVAVDPELAAEIAETSIAAQGIHGITSVIVTIEDDDTVLVTLEASHPSVFARSVPGGADHFDVRAIARAQAITAGEDPSVR